MHKNKIIKIEERRTEVGIIKKLDEILKNRSAVIEINRG